MAAKDTSYDRRSLYEQRKEGHRRRDKGKDRASCIEDLGQRHQDGKEDALHREEPCGRCLRYGRFPPEAQT